HRAPRAPLAGGVAPYLPASGGAPEGDGGGARVDQQRPAGTHHEHPVAAAAACARDLGLLPREVPHRPDLVDVPVLAAGLLGQAPPSRLEDLRAAAGRGLCSIGCGQRRRRLAVGSAAQARREPECCTQDGDADLRATGCARRLRRLCGQSLAGGRHRWAGYGGSSGLFRQSLCPARRRVPEAGGRLRGRNRWRGRCDRRHVDGPICRVGAGANRQLHPHLHHRRGRVSARACRGPRTDAALHRSSPRLGSSPNATLTVLPGSSGPRNLRSPLTLSCVLTYLINLRQSARRFTAGFAPSPRTRRWLRIQLELLHDRRTDALNRHSDAESHRGGTSIPELSCYTRGVHTLLNLARQVSASAVVARNRQATTCWKGAIVSSPLALSGGFTVHTLRPFLLGVLAAFSVTSTNAPAATSETNPVRTQPATAP